MAALHEIPVRDGTVRVAFTERSDGDFRVDQEAEVLAPIRARLMPRPWTWLRQVHGAEVVTVGRPGEAAGTRADAAVTGAPGCPVAVTTADCAPVVLVAEGGVAVVHAGWRGLVAGVVESASAALTAVAGAPVAALIGPCIGPAAYEFGPVDLERASAALGAVVRSSTAWGTPALDVPRAVTVALERCGWPLPAEPPPCTSDDRWYSHRTRGDSGRQAAVAWFEAGGV